MFSVAPLVLVSKPGCFQPAVSLLSNQDSKSGLNHSLKAQSPLMPDDEGSALGPCIQFQCSCAMDNGNGMVGIREAV